MLFKSNLLSTKKYLVEKIFYIIIVTKKFWASIDIYAHCFGAIISSVNSQINYSFQNDIGTKLLHL